MGRREEPAWAKSTVGMLQARERGDVTWQFKNRLMVTKSLINRLGMIQELNGHMGCVNCLEWNYDGSILASASDDLHVILWDPYRYKQLNKITTGHTGNIFSVKFLTPDIIATCAADATVRVRAVDGSAQILECSCHCGRVKRLATAPYCPDLVWSAAEDGLVIQHDLRAPHDCSSNNPNLLVNLLNHVGRYAEAKCIAVNPRRPYQLALGANDFYVRLYDMRMIKLAKLEELCLGGGGAQGERKVVRCTRAGHGDPEHNIPTHAATYYAPGHLSMEPNEHTFPKKSTTYVSFSDDGNELLVNLGSEQIYIFDINCGRRPVLVESFIISHNHGSKLGAANSVSGGAGGAGAAGVALPDHVREMKDKANEYLNAGSFALAVETYNSAIEQCRDSAVLYSNRAAALLRRNWSGDMYAAIRDCYTAISLDPQHVKAHFRLAKALMNMKKARESQECLLYFKERFPRHAKSHAVFLLEKDINDHLAKPEGHHDDGPYESEESQPLSALERTLRAAAIDYRERCLGHCNSTTDIKEAVFLGPDAQFIAAGSDDGCMYIWSRSSGNIIRALRGDESIVNCVQPHPNTFLIATSGIESVVRLWSLTTEDGAPDPRVVSELSAIASANQQRMRSDPFEAMLYNISFAAGDRDHAPACRPT